MRQQFVAFLVRFAANCFGLWLAANVFDVIEYGGQWAGLIVGGLVLALLNAIVKPILVVLTLPAIALTLGLFLIVVNGLVVYFAAALYGPLNVSSIGMAVLAGMVIGLVNYMVNMLLEKRI